MIDGRRVRLRPWVVALLVLAATARAALAQAPTSPGPYVLDARGVTITLPNDPAFFPPLAADSFIPGRGFGADLGAHVYRGRLGRSALGFGANWLWLRGTTSTTRTGPGVHSVFTAVAPQVSFNFGTGAGWSYIGGGAGIGSISSSTHPAAGAGASLDGGQQLAINVGGGAKWFFSKRKAVAFDVRFHRLMGRGGVPGASLMAVSAGFALR